MFNSALSWMAAKLSPLRHNTGVYPLGYSPGLDGLRGVIMLGVMAGHLRETWVTGVSVLMDGFFMLSAYLITALLVRDWQRDGRMDWWRFYLRRVLRLFPAFYTMLLVFVLAAVFVYDNPMGHLREALTAGLYVSNWSRAASVPTPGYLGHTWSLSIEEQFYIVWPLLLGLLLRVAGLRRRAVLCLVFAALIASTWRWWLTVQGATISRVYNGTDTRADALLMGCALGLALSLPGVRSNLKLQAWIAKSGTPAALILLFAALRLDWQDRQLYMYWSFLLLPVTLTLMSALILPVRTVVRQLLEAAPLVLIGRISYGLYLWHWPIFCTLREGWGFGFRGVLLAGVPLTFAVAVVSYLLIERPFLARKDRMRQSQIEAK